MYYCFEYIWLDGFNKLRSKTKVIDFKMCDGSINDIGLFNINLLPLWNYDGSSTGQATGFFSDVFLKPVQICNDPFRNNNESFLVLCETCDENNIPHKTNHRHACNEITKLTQGDNPLFGIEQEYIIYNKSNKIPYGWISEDMPNELYIGQGPYYCGVGGDVAYGRQIAETHLQ